VAANISLVLFRVPFKFDPGKSRSKTNNFGHKLTI